MVAGRLSIGGFPRGASNRRLSYTRPHLVSVSPPSIVRLSFFSQVSYTSLAAFCSTSLSQLLIQFMY